MNVVPANSKLLNEEQYVFCGGSAALTPGTLTWPRCGTMPGMACIRKCVAYVDVMQIVHLR